LVSEAAYLDSETHSVDGHAGDDGRVWNAGCRCQRTLCARHRYRKKEDFVLRHEPERARKLTFFASCLNQEWRDRVEKQCRRCFLPAVAIVAHVQGLSEDPEDIDPPGKAEGPSQQLGKLTFEPG